MFRFVCIIHVSGAKRNGKTGKKDMILRITPGNHSNGVIASDHAIRNLWLPLFSSGHELLPACPSR